MPMNADNLGNEMFDAMIAVDMNQDSTEFDDIGRLRMKALAQAIVDHIISNATINVLATTSIPAGLGPHIHTPVTDIATGKIS